MANAEAASTQVATRPARPNASGNGPGMMPNKSMLSLLVGVAALIALVVASVMWSQQPDYRVLFANVADKDGGAIVAQLSQMNIPYKHADGGGAILVPSDKVHDVRLRLASQGLPKGGTVGFELMEGQKFGATQFQEQVNYQRGLEGELAKSIQSLASVQSARVHLAMPKQSVFLREQQKPTASVIVNLHSGRSLDRAQVAGIVHLVSSSIPELSLKSVAVLDQSGTLLSQAPDSGMAGQLDPAQLGYAREVDDGYAKRILDLVEPIVGRGNVRAQVTSDIDFSVVESTAELFAPNQGAETKAAIRSQSTAESNGSNGTNAAGAGGVPGALSNQPPSSPTAPIAGGTNGAAGAAVAGGSGRREAMTNYEVDKTVRRIKNQTGSVKRLSAAVVVNHRKTTDAAGKDTYAPLSEAELAQISSLVRETVGFNKERGDSVNVVNAPFSIELQTAATPVQWWQEADTKALAREVGKGFAMLLGIAFVVFGVVRPAMKQLSMARPADAMRSVNQAALPSPDEVAVLPSPRADRMQGLRDVAKSDPAVVASVVRQWVGKNG